MNGMPLITCSLANRPGHYAYLNVLFIVAVVSDGDALKGECTVLTVPGVSYLVAHSAEAVENMIDTVFSDCT